MNKKTSQDGLYVYSNPGDPPPLPPPPILPQQQSDTKMQPQVTWIKFKSQLKIVWRLGRERRASTLLRRKNNNNNNNNNSSIRNNNNKIGQF